MRPSYLVASLISEKGPSKKNGPGFLLLFDLSLNALRLNVETRGRRNRLRGYVPHRGTGRLRIFLAS